MADSERYPISYQDFSAISRLMRSDVQLQCHVAKLLSLCYHPTGRPPQVVARGGFSGLFPDASQFAYQFALSTSLPDVVLFCDLQFSSDKTGFCKTGLTLDNSTTVSEIFPKMERTYKVHGEDVHGWFSLDFTADQLIQNVTCKQKLLSN